MGITGFFTEMTTASMVIRSIGAGFILGSLISTITRRGTYNIVQRLLKKQATSQESAVTIKQMGLEKSPYARFALREESSVRKGVYRVSADGGETTDKKRKKVKINFDSARFYIPEERMAYVTARYGRGASIGMWIIGSVITAAAVETAVYLVPKLIEML